MKTTYQMFVETSVPNNHLIISRTNLRGIITYANETFADISGYSVDELIGQPHNIVRHPDMPKSVFCEIWETLQKEEIWRGYVKNLRKDGGYYWVYAEISGVYKDNQLIEYKSMRSPVEEEMKIIMQNKYDALKKQEEGLCRVVVYLSCDTIAKVQKLAFDEKKEADEVVNAILNDTLF